MDFLVGYQLRAGWAGSKAGKLHAKTLQELQMTEEARHTEMSFFDGR